MAEAAEIKKLNRTVEEAVNMLKVYFGNSAQMRNMNDKQREAIEKWFDVGKEAEDTIKQQRAFTERERDAKGRFLKKQEVFTGSLMGIVNSITGIFTGMAKSVGSYMGGIAKGVTTHIRNFFNTLKSHFLGLFGEESEWFDILSSIKDSIVGFFGWFARGFVFLFRKTPGWAGRIIKILGNMYALQIKQMKMEFLGGDTGKKKGIWGKILTTLGILLFALAAGFGAWLHRKLLALNLLWKGFKLTRLFNFFKMKFLGFWTKIDDFINLLSKLPIVGRAIRGVKFGLKYLGWPLTLLLSIIDFIKGWKAETGDWQDKLFNGLKNVFHGILELPVKILGWAYDSILNLFGVESTGTSDKIKKWLDKLMDFMLEWGPLGIITDIIKGFTSEGGFKEALRGKVEKLQGIFINIMDFITNIWNGFLEWAVDKVKNIPWLGDKIKSLSGNLMLNIPEKPKTIEPNVPQLIASHERKKAEVQLERTDRIAKAVEDQTKAVQTHSQKSDNAIQAMTAISQGNQSAPVEQKQIPDEVDNYMMLMKCHNGGYD